VSKAVLGCHKVLNTLGKFNSVTLMWIPDHSDFTGNAKADELAKLGSEAVYIGTEPALGMAHGKAKKSITEWCYQEYSDLWLRTTGLVHCKEFIKGPSKNRTNNLLQLSRRHLRTVTALNIGHCQQGVHMHRIGLECPWCMEDDKSAAHLLPPNSRSSIFGRADVRPEDLGNLSSRGVIRFLRDSSILDEL